MRLAIRKGSKFGPFLLLTLLFSVGFWGCDLWEGRLPDSILVRVNEEEIAYEDFERELKDQLLEPGREGKGDDLEALRRAYLDQVIERKILTQEARRQGVKILPEELNRAVSEIKRDYPNKGFDERLGLKGTTPDEWKFRLEEKLLAERMVRKALQYPGEISEKDALDYYEAHRSSFRLEPKVRARQIVVADGAEAIQILKRLKKGERFEQLAQEKSLGPEKVNGGDLGDFSQGEKPSEFDRVFTMEVGAISDVIKSPYGYHIFKLERKTEAREIPFEEARAGILQELRKRREEEEYQRWFQELRRKSKVRINKKWFPS